MLKTNIFVGPSNELEGRPDASRLATLRSRPEQWISTPYFWRNLIPVKFLIEQDLEDPSNGSFQIWSTRPRAPCEARREFKSRIGYDYGREETFFYDHNASRAVEGIRVTALVSPYTFQVRTNRITDEEIAVRAIIVAQTVHEVAVKPVVLAA